MGEKVAGSPNREFGGIEEDGQVTRDLRGQGRRVIEKKRGLGDDYFLSFPFFKICLCLVQNTNHFACGHLNLQLYT